MELDGQKYGPLEMSVQFCLSEVNNIVMELTTDNLNPDGASAPATSPLAEAGSLHFPRFLGGPKPGTP